MNKCTVPNCNGHHLKGQRIVSLFSIITGIVIITGLSKINFENSLYFFFVSMSAVLCIAYGIIGVTEKQ